MGRLGVGLEQLPGVLNVLSATTHLALEGLSTHLASSEVMDAPSVAEQERNFDAAQRMVRAAGLEPTFVHMANTGAVISRRETWNTMVRPGVALYGYYLPFQRAGREVSGGTLRLPVKPILIWKTRILSLRNLAANQALGYNGNVRDEGPGSYCRPACRLCGRLQPTAIESWPGDCARTLCADCRTHIDGPPWST